MFLGKGTVDADLGIPVACETVANANAASFHELGETARRKLGYNSVPGGRTLGTFVS